MEMEYRFQHSTENGWIAELLGAQSLGPHRQGSWFQPSHWPRDPYASVSSSTEWDRAGTATHSCWRGCMNSQTWNGSGQDLVAGKCHRKVCCYSSVCIFSSTFQALSPQTPPNPPDPFWLFPISTQEFPAYSQERGNSSASRKGIPAWGIMHSCDWTKGF